MSPAENELTALRANAAALKQSIEALKDSPAHAVTVAEEKGRLAEISARISELSPAATS